MRRLYFLLPNIDVTHKLVDDLLLARVEDRHMHVIAKEGTPLQDVREASPLQKIDFIPALEKGWWEAPIWAFWLAWSPPPFHPQGG